MLFCIRISQFSYCTPFPLVVESHLYFSVQSAVYNFPFIDVRAWITLFYYVPRPCFQEFNFNNNYNEGLLWINKVATRNDCIRSYNDRACMYGKDLFTRRLNEAN